jgi:hypothetical protein
MTRLAVHAGEYKKTFCLYPETGTTRPRRPAGNGATGEYNEPRIENGNRRGVVLAGGPALSFSRPASRRRQSPFPL